MYDNFLIYTASILCRVKSYIRNGWANNVTNPDLVPQTLPSSSDSAQGPPCEDVVWKDNISKVFCRKDVPLFTERQLISYFAERRPMAYLLVILNQ